MHLNFSDRPECYYFESVEMLRRVLFIGAIPLLSAKVRAFYELGVLRKLKKRQPTH